MRFALFFAGLSAVFTVLAVQLGPLTLAGGAGLLTAVGFVGPAVAYATGRPQLLGKSEAGRQAGWAQLVHGSYLGLCRLSWTLARARGGDAWNAVTPTVLIGARPTRAEAERLLSTAKVGAVLDLTCELVVPARLRSRTTYLCLPVLDVTAPSPAQLDRAVAFVSAEQARHPVYVHCAVGRGRSATVLVAWALADGRAVTVDDAEAYVRAARPVVRLRLPQRAAVAAWWARRTAPPA